VVEREGKTVKFAYRPNPHLYEINTWVWLEQLSRAAGKRITLGKVPDQEWDRLRALGFDFIWLMGVWERSALGRRIARTDATLFPGYDEALPGWTVSQVAGSAYSVRAYRPDPRIGTWQELAVARRKLRVRRLGLILDFVSNHTALDHEWIKTHPEYFLQGSQEEFRRDPAAFFLVEKESGATTWIARARDPFFPPWPDVAQLNCFHPGARRAMIGELRRIARHCDGVRCDMAMLLLNDVFARTWSRLLGSTPAPPQEFWAEAVAALPNLIWIAEVYWDLEERMQQLGFQFAYDKRLYDCLRSGSPGGVRDRLRAPLRYQAGMVRFLENHDEPRSAAVFGKEKLPAVATLAATLPGLRFYHHGQSDGKRLRPPVQLGAEADEPTDPEIRALYEKLLRINNEELLHGGAWRLLEAHPAGDGTHENLVAYQWRSEQAWKIVVVNLGGAAAQAQLRLGDEISASARYRFFDQMNDALYRREGAELARDGLFVRLEGWRAHVFAVTAE